jgi:hypothetical protein
MREPRENNPITTSLPGATRNPQRMCAKDEKRGRRQEIGEKSWLKVEKLLKVESC